MPVDTVCHLVYYTHQQIAMSVEKENTMHILLFFAWTVGTVWITYKVCKLAHESARK